MQSNNEMRTPGLEPGWVAPPAPKADFAPRAEGRQREAAPLDPAGNRSIPLETTTATTTALGPLQRALREAGLPVEVAALQHLEDLARKAFKIADDRVVTPKEFRKAARLHRRLVENPRQLSKVREGLTVRQAKAVLMREHGITTGRQWKNWKRRQARVLRAAQARAQRATQTRPVQEEGRTDA